MKEGSRTGGGKPKKKGETFLNEERGGRGKKRDEEDVWGRYRRRSLDPNELKPGFIGRFSKTLNVSCDGTGRLVKGRIEGGGRHEESVADRFYHNNGSGSRKFSLHF